MKFKDIAKEIENKVITFRGKVQDLSLDDMLVDLNEISTLLTKAVQSEIESDDMNRMDELKVHLVGGAYDAVKNGINQAEPVVREILGKIDAIMNKYKSQYNEIFAKESGLEFMKQKVEEEEEEDVFASFSDDSEDPDGNFSDDSEDPDGKKKHIESNINVETNIARWAGGDELNDDEFFNDLVEKNTSPNQKSNVQDEDSENESGFSSDDDDLEKFNEEDVVSTRQSTFTHTNQSKEAIQNLNEEIKNQDKKVEVEHH